MNCQIFETVVNDLAREQMMEANARDAALAHGGDCEACALRLSLERQLTSGLRDLAAEMALVSASARVEQQVLEAFRSQAPLLVETRPASRSGYWLAAAAAVVLIAFGIAAMKWGSGGPAQTAIKTNDSSDAPNSPKRSEVSIKNSNTKPTPKQTSKFYQPRRRQTVRGNGNRSAGGNVTYVAKGRDAGRNTADGGNSVVIEVTTQFLPLTYASAGNLQDGGQLVRVELPRSAMVSLGVPVNMERYGERVKADVLVSADGLARAIRFVQ